MFVTANQVSPGRTAILHYVKITVDTTENVKKENVFVISATKEKPAKRNIATIIALDTGIVIKINAFVIKAGSELLAKRHPAPTIVPTTEFA